MGCFPILHWVSCEVYLLVFKDLPKLCDLFSFHNSSFFPLLVPHCFSIGIVELLFIYSVL